MEVVNTQKKMKYATVAFIAFACLVTLAYASYSIFSNIVTLTVSDYTLTVDVDESTPVLYHAVTFTGSLHLGTGPVTGATITLYQSDDQISWIAVNNTETDGDGAYSILQNMTVSGTVYFRTEYRAP
jgi:hypothetical protein